MRWSSSRTRTTIEGVAKHPGLLDVLTEGLWYLHQVFPESDRFAIALESGRESPGWEYAAVYVQTALPVPEAHDRLAPTPG